LHGAGSSRGARAGVDVYLDKHSRDSDEIYASFCHGVYCSSTGLDEKEWEIMYREFVASGLVVKSEPDSG